jgi:hypothetical protein
MTEYSLFIIVILAKSGPKIKLLLGRKTDAFIPLPKMDSKQKDCFDKSTMTMVMMIAVDNARRPQWGKEKAGKPGSCSLAFESLDFLHPGHHLEDAIGSELASMYHKPTPILCSTH